jgi:hypothetical protein
LFINQIIHDFKQIARGIKTGKQEFVGIPLQESVKQRACKRGANIGLADPMLKRGLVEQVISEHIAIIYGTGKNLQGSGFAGRKM